MKVLLLIGFLLLLSSCITTTTQKLSPSVYYKQDICFTYKIDKSKKEIKAEKNRNWNWGSNTSFDEYVIENKKIKFCGVGVLPYSDSYKLQIDSFGKLNFFSLTTCHEEDTTENPDRGIFKKNGRTEINYMPTLEKGKACPLYVAAYSKKQRHAWGILVFEHPRYQLRAKLHCNGYIRRANGVSICQSRKHLIQKIEFNEEVKLIRPVKGAADRQTSCPEIEVTDGKSFEFVLPARECIYGFIGKKSKKIHQLFAVGYEDIIVRE